MVIEEKIEVSLNSEDIITPWNVQGINNDGVDYEKVIEKFGASRIDDELIRKLENAIGRKAHYLIKRGIFISHRDLDKIIDLYVEKEPFYLYTGISPSESMHLGHYLPFTISKWLQEVFDVPIIIQITDDEKVLWKDLKVENVSKLVQDTVKDIIALGFDESKTFIFSSFTYMGQTPEYYRNIIKIQKCVTYGEVKGFFGFNDSDLIGKIVFPAIQIVPTLSTTFPEIFGTKKIQPLVLSALDQDPYFRMMRNISPQLGFPLPALLHSSFSPALQGVNTKMSSSDLNSAIFFNDTAKQLKTKVNKHAFSGGRVTVEEHRELGGDTNIDVPYHLLKFFLADDEELEKIRISYSTGEMLSGEIKKRTVECLQEIVSNHQEKRKLVTDQIIKQFMTPRKLNFNF